MQLQLQGLRLTVDPLGQVEHGEFVRPRVRGVVTVVSEIPSAIAVGLEVAGTVVQVILRNGLLRVVPPAQAPVDAVGKRFR